MIIEYTPEGGEAEQYDARTLRTSEASIAQRTAGMKWGEIEEGIENDDPEAMRVIVWVIKKRSQPSLRYSEFDPLIGEMTSRMSRQEVVDYVENAFALADTDSDVSRDQVVQVLQRIIKVAADPEHAEQFINEMARGPKDEASQDMPQPEPESSSPSSTTPTSTSSEESGSDSSPTSSTSLLQPSTI